MKVINVSTNWQEVVYGGETGHLASSQSAEFQGSVSIGGVEYGDTSQTNSVVYITDNALVVREQRSEVGRMLNGMEWGLGIMAVLAGIWMAKRGLSVVSGGQEL